MSNLYQNQFSFSQNTPNYVKCMNTTDKITNEFKILQNFMA